VEKISDFLVETVAFHLMRGVMTQAVSMPRERGATPSKTNSRVFSEASPERMAG